MTNLYFRISSHLFHFFNLFLIFHSNRSQICCNCWRRLNPRCHVCCSSCGLARYCGDHCKKEGLEEHAEECSLEKNERRLSDQLRLIVKIWRKIRREGVEKMEVMGTLFRCWNDLIDHVDEMLLNNKELLAEQYALLKAVLKDSEIPPWKVFLSIYGKVVTNCFSLRSDR